MIKRVKPLYSYKTGFTLLEVLIALTLTAMVMGSLFAMLSQNKKLTIHSLSALERMSQERLAIHASWINLDFSKIGNHSKLNKKYSSNNIQILEISEQNPSNKTSIKNLKFKLESIDIFNEDQQKLFTSVRWVEKK